MLNIAFCTRSQYIDLKLKYIALHIRHWMSNRGRDVRETPRLMWIPTYSPVDKLFWDVVAVVQKGGMKRSQR